MKIKSLLALTAVAAAGFAIAVLTAPAGCASNCGANCPSAVVYIGTNNNQELNGILTGLDVNGAGCPDRSAITCAGDRETTVCTHVLITGHAVGPCDVLFQFSDRPSEIVRLQFGPTVNANGSCCKGYPVLGPSVYTIPPKPTGPIYSGTVDAGTYDTDAVVVLTDAGTHDAAASRDAGTDARDAGTDAHDAAADARDAGGQ